MRRTDIQAVPKLDETIESELEKVRTFLKNGGSGSDDLR